MADSQRINLPLFIDGYIKNEAPSNLTCHFRSSESFFVVIGSKLDLGLMLDNFIRNAQDWKAKNMWIECGKIEGKLRVDVYDDGLGLSVKFKDNPDEIFNFAATGKSSGTGFGMYLIRESLKTFDATISIEEPINNKGIHFRMLFR